MLSGDYNPNLANVSLTKAAAEYIKQALFKHPGSLGLYLSVKKSGCSGLSYVVDYARVDTENALKFSLEEGLDVFIERQSFLYLQGIKIDYVKTGLSAGLKFLNPNEKAVCGCGESFSVEKEGIDSG